MDFPCYLPNSLEKFLTMHFLILNTRKLTLSSYLMATLPLTSSPPQSQTVMENSLLASTATT